MAVGAQGGEAPGVGGPPSGYGEWGTHGDGPRAAA